MIEKITSHDSTLHIVCRHQDEKNERTDIINENEYLQVSLLNLSSGRIFDPHIHIKKDLKDHTQITQEVWIIISGSVKVDYFDTSGSFIDSRIIHKGDISITLRGGHSYTVLEDNTLVYECKTGPYYGLERDKVFI